MRLQLACHETHVWIDVVETALPRAQIVQSRFAIRRLREAMLGTFAIAGKPHFAVSAVLRQAALLGLAELGLLW